MSNTTLLLISNRPEDLAFATSAAASGGLTVQKIADPEKAGVYIADASENIPVIMVDASNAEQYQKFEEAIQEKVGLFSDKINANAIHFITSEQLEKTPYLIHSQLFGHLILRNYQSPEKAGEHYSRIIKAVQVDRAFGLKQLMKEGTKIQKVTLVSTTQKQSAVEAVRNFLVAAKFQQRTATVVANAVDEILMNAMFDAPVDEVGRTLFASTARSTALKLEGRHKVEMEVGYDDSYIGVTAIDYFGSLDKVKLLTHIAKIYTDEEYQVRTSVAGAGIGLATVFRSGGSFFFVSESQTRTEVTVFYKRTDSYREFKDQFRFLSTQFYF